MARSSEAITGSASPSSPISIRPWSPEEDAVLLRHALHCGTRQWGELGRSGQLKRNNKSCCNRYIFLRSAAAPNASAFSVACRVPLSSMTDAPQSANAAAVSSPAAACDAAAVNNVIRPGAAALSLPMKRPRGDWSGPLEVPHLLGRPVFGSLGPALGHADALDTHCVQQGGERSGVQQVVWPRVESGRALLLEEHGQLERRWRRVQRMMWPDMGSGGAALSAPPPIQLTALAGSVSAGMNSCVGGTPLASASNRGQELPSAIGSCNVGQETDSLFIDAPVSVLCLAGRGPTGVPLASGPQRRALAASLPEPGLAARLLEQRGTGEGGVEGVEVGEGVSQLQYQLNSRERFKHAHFPALSLPRPLPHPLRQAHIQSPILISSSLGASPTYLGLWERRVHLQRPFLIMMGIWICVVTTAP
ncbi:hypothetical protein CLOP_g19050 [Closterium sp. NIES-67]|nr:hypothetical protein CLOP_g19050 [Closterium sp. NIES-67]